MRNSAVWSLIAFCVFIAGCRGLDSNISAPAISPAATATSATSASPAPVPSPIPTPAPVPVPPSPTPAPTPPPQLEHFYWTSAEGDAGQMSLDLQSGFVRPVGSDLHLPAVAAGISVTAALSEVGLTSPRRADLDFSNPPDGDQVILATRDAQSGALSEEPPQFPSEGSNRLETSFLHPNGKFAYTIVDGPAAQGGDNEYSILSQIYKRQNDGRFTLFNETGFDNGSQFMCPHYVISGMLHVDADYLLVNSGVGCHPDGGSQLQLWRLSSSGVEIQDRINVSASNFDGIVEGWKDDLLITTGDMNIIGSNTTWYGYVFRIVGGQLEQVAKCDAAIRPDCPYLDSVVVGPTKAYAYGLEDTATPGQAKLVLINWDSSSGNMVFSDSGILASTGHSGILLANIGDKLYVDATGQFLLVTGSDAKLVRVFKINSPNGSLNEVPGSPFSAPGTILDLAFVPQP